MATFGDLQAAASSHRDPDEESGDDSDDSEYVPPGPGDNEASSCSEESASGDDEGPAGEDEEGGGGKPAVWTTKQKVAGKKPGRRQRRRGPSAAGIGGGYGSRARRGGIRLEDEVVESQPAAVPAAEQADAPPAPLLPDPSEEKSQKRAADLYASFLSDVGARPAASATAAASGSVARPTTTAETITKTTASTSAAAAPATKTTKVFEFAGEAVTVEVPAPPPSSSSTAASSASAKRPSAVGGGVQSLLERLSKRPKLSTLEKSRLDWETFKSAEGISEDLAAHNRGRGGFLEKRAFLERSDYRQFELERDARLSSSRQGQGSGGGRKP